MADTDCWYCDAPKPFVEDDSGQLVCDECLEPFVAENIQAMADHKAEAVADTLLARVASKCREVALLLDGKGETYRALVALADELDP